MYWNIIDKDRYKLLKNITEIVSIPNYYMIGGTALSLQLGLRESFDFDFCVPEQFNNEILLHELEKLGTMEVKQNQKGTCDVILNGVQISFFYYPNKVIKNFIIPKEMPRLKLASILDIAVMKLIAIGGRGAKKDFFDLYNILTKSDIMILELANGLLQKCGENTNYANIIMGLSYFEDAEQEILPKAFVKYDWENIKTYFMELQPKIQSNLEKLGI
ncbi:MAG: nucleotidyl transferase AbiEii/AbiGii toxin family protein [Clostridia bacterium]|nr:nucleotidyl transferase AbiEii/AbiGii toxin family protein [Clostridia bacterium]